ncbi:RnfABCDGE type electron transport complex subunit D [Erysipelotrichaceae bacterium OttesenSCG-928-M19]|nr:RnfABCDGE type electron transport complex subunit D [Erysipelotrichaceae bacterium OttesenSCG-928-M19]
MKFKYSVSPNYHSSVDTKQIMSSVTKALIFVSLFSIVLQYNLYGMAGSIRAILILAVAMITTTAVDYIYWKLRKTSKDELSKKVNQNVPIITGMILALTLPLGDLASYEILYVTFISAIAAELFGKLIYGGFGYNIFNPAGVGRAFALLAFGKQLVIPAIDGLASASPLATMQGENGLTEVLNTFNNYSSLIFGVHQGALGETVVIALIIAAVYLVIKQAIDWVIPVCAIGTIALLAIVDSAFGTFSLDFIMVHVLSGGLIFGAVFMLTDPVTNPLNRQGKIIYAIIFALITFLIRTKASLPEGVVFAILIVNMLVPMIDKLTANVTNEGTGKKVLSIVVTLGIAVLMTVLFQFV